jgi:hypothetical protein
MAAGVGVLVPALLHGVSLGPYDLLSQHGLSAQSGVVVHNSVNHDQIASMIPWSTLAWNQVHQGHLPLWNLYSGLGTPLAFNWQSAAFSVPSLLGYLVPVKLAYTVAVVATVTIAGTGAYVLARLLRLGIVACALAGTVYALCGPLAAWLGYPVTSVMSWAGWLFAAALLILRGRHRASCIALFAFILAQAVYAGYPESLVILVVALIAYLAVLLGLRARSVGGLRGIVRPVIDLSIAGVAGAVLAAPLALPGLQLAASSSRSGEIGVQALGGGRALPIQQLAHLVFQGFDGLPVAGNNWFGYSVYPVTAVYVGVIVVVLAVMAVRARWRRPEVLAFAGVSVVMGALVFVPTVMSLIRSLPGLGKVNWLLALAPMALCLSLLAGVGMDALARSHSERAVRRWTGGGFLAVGLVLLGMWLGGRGTLPPGEAHIRATSFTWPVVETATGLAVIAGLALADRRIGWRRAVGEIRGLHVGAGRWAALTLLACETAFLIAAGAPLWSSSARFFTPTAAETSLQRAVGSSTVGFGTSSCLSANVGILPNANIVYGVHELSVYDPIIPRSYYQSWTAATGRPAGLPTFNLFCPAVMTVAEARRYGVAFILEPGGARSPVGGVFNMKIGDEDLYQIPGASAATISALPRSGSFPPADTVGTPVAVTYSDPSTWKVATSASTPQVLRLRLTDVPGWHATVDGRPLRLEGFAGVMLQAKVPAGPHTVELSYWPKAFTAGIALAACSAAGLALAVIIDWARRHRVEDSLVGCHGDESSRGPAAGPLSRGPVRDVVDNV